jgi:hypothetical protein
VGLDLALAGRTSEALAPAPSAPEAFRRADLIEAVVVAQTKSADYAGALKTARQLSDDARRARALARIASQRPR